MKFRIAAALAGTLAPPDIEAAARASFPVTIADRLFPRPLVAAAVLVPLVERDTGLTLLLTRRTEQLRDHAGQISFPGGRLEREDAGPVAAALRETREELGIDPALVEVIGYLPVQPVVTGFAVVPVVGMLSPAHVIRLDPREVAETFEVPLEFLADPGRAQRGVRDFRGISWPTVEYHYEGRRIWGATAQMINALVYKLISNNIL